MGFPPIEVLREGYRVESDIAFEEILNDVHARTAKLMVETEGVYLTKHGVGRHDYDEWVDLYASLKAVDLYEYHVQMRDSVSAYKNRKISRDELLASINGLVGQLTGLQRVVELQHRSGSMSNQTFNSHSARISRIQKCFVKTARKPVMKREGYNIGFDSETKRFCFTRLPSIPSQEHQGFQST